MKTDLDLFRIAMKAATPTEAFRTIYQLGIEEGISRMEQRLRIEREAAEAEEVGTVDDAEDYLLQRSAAGDYRTR